MCVGRGGPPFTDSEVGGYSTTSTLHTAQASHRQPGTVRDKKEEVKRMEHKTIILSVKDKAGYRLMFGVQRLDDTSRAWQKMRTKVARGGEIDEKLYLELAQQFATAGAALRDSLIELGE